MTLFLASVAVVQSSSTRKLRKRSLKKKSSYCKASRIEQLFNCLDEDEDGFVTLAEAEKNRRCYRSYGLGLVEFFKCVDSGNNPTADIAIDLNEALEKGCDCVPW
jgi:hypothetical protein